MTAIESAEEVPTAAHVTMVYQGPTAPHWEMESHFGDQKLVEAFWTRVYARLLLLPKHDPQFRRNRERVNRDAERENIVCDWDLGEGDAETTQTTVINPADIEVSEAAEGLEIDAGLEVLDQGTSEETYETDDFDDGQEADSLGQDPAPDLAAIPNEGDEEEE